MVRCHADVCQEFIASESPRHGDPQAGEYRTDAIKNLIRHLDLAKSFLEIAWESRDIPSEIGNQKVTKTSYHNERAYTQKCSQIRHAYFVRVPGLPWTIK